jgi:hypothetical protein
VAGGPQAVSGLDDAGSDSENRVEQRDVSHTSQGRRAVRSGRTRSQLGQRPGTDPVNAALPKENTPPSAAAIQ